MILLILLRKNNLIIGYLFFLSVICEAGTYQSDNTCLYCGVGNFSSSGSTGCSECPDGKITPGIGYSSVEDCFGMDNLFERTKFLERPLN